MASFLQIPERVHYALVLVTTLAKDTKRHQNLTEITKEYNLSQGYMEEIASKLKIADIVEAKKGKNGGYVLKKPAEDIFVLDIIDALEKQNKAVSCADCRACTTCKAEPVMEDVEKTFRKMLKDKKISDYIK